MGCKHRTYQVNEDGFLACTECGRISNSERWRAAQEQRGIMLPEDDSKPSKKMGPHPEDKAVKKPKINPKKWR